MSADARRAHDPQDGAARAARGRTPTVLPGGPPIDPGARVTDVMLWEPKTLPATATVEEVRRFLAHEHFAMALLTDGSTFCAAITQIPDTAAEHAQASAFADPAPPVIAPTESATTAFARAAASPHRRLIVLDGEGPSLLGLVCVSTDGRRFCKHAGRHGTRRT